MDIAVVLKCSDDFRIFRCIKSIPPDVEIVCSITSNPLIENGLKKLGIPYCITPKGNLSVTINAGISLAKSNNIIIMDSDSYFGDGAIQSLYEALKENIVVRGRLIFLYNTSLNRVIAELRDYVNQQPVAYAPGLAFRREILSYIGGYFFSPYIPWAVDAAFTYRIEEAGIRVKIVPNAIIYHDSISLYHDLRAAFRIGGGKRLIVELTGKYNKEDISPTIINLLNGKFIKEGIHILKHKGVKVLLYNFLWNIVYYIGYYTTRFKTFINKLLAKLSICNPL